MWLYLSPGFLSVVAHRTEPEKLLVRARHPDHIHAVFHRTVVQSTVADYIKNMTYDNFKGSIEDANYHGVCLDVWRTMWAYGSRYRRGGV